MSTIVGLRFDNKLFMGSDGQCTTESGEIKAFKVKKVFDNGPYIIGFVGSIRSGQLLLPKVFKPPENILDFPDEIIKQLKENNCITEEQSTYSVQSNFLIGDRRTKQLFEVGGDFQFNEILDYTAIGSGLSYALGSLQTTTELNINDGRLRIEKALKAAARFDVATGPPLLITISN